MDYKNQEELLKKQVTCPLCSKGFSLIDIEAHADTCLGDASAPVPKEEKKQANPRITDEDFMGAIEQARKAISSSNKLDKRQVLAILDNLVNKYEDETPEDREWVKVEPKDAIPDPSEQQQEEVVNNKR